MKVTIGDFLLLRLKQVGITEVIGVPGDFNLSFLEQLGAMDGIRFVGACNELNASYAADGYARTRGIGAVLTTYGVGELSALNRIAGAAAEHLPVISIAGAPPLFAIEGHFQLHHSLADGDFDSTLASLAPFTAVTTRITPHNAVSEIDRVLQIAVRQSRPVHLHLPSDITHVSIEAPDSDFHAWAPPSDPELLNTAVDLILNRFSAATHPALLIDLDAGRHGFAPILRAFAEKTGTPYAQLSTGKAILSERSSLFRGTYSGAYSTPEVQTFIEDADFLLTTSPRFTESNSGFFSQVLPEKGTIDVGPHYVRVHGQDLHGQDLHGITGQEVLAKLVQRVVPRLPAEQGREPSCAERLERSAASLRLSQDYLWPRLSRFLREDDVVITETGTSSLGMGSQPMPAGLSYITSLIWGSIGYTLPALLGSQLAARHRRHLLFIGDGSFQTTAQELSTVLREGLTPIIFLINNRGYTIERWILGMNAGYNDVANWEYTSLPDVFAPGAAMKTYSARTQGELENVLGQLEDAGAGALVELHLGPFDAPAPLRAFGPLIADFDYGSIGPRNTSNP